MTEEELVEIGGKPYIIDPKGKGEKDRPSFADEHLVAQTPNAKDVAPGTVPAYSYKWTKGMSKAATTSYTFCGNHPCPKGPLPGRRYCSNWCMTRASDKRRARRDRGFDRWLDEVGGAAVQFSRPFPRTMQSARRLFVEHISRGVCQFRSEDDYCPSTKNPYADPGVARCLIYATYADDYMIWQARNAGYPARRRYTTEDGRWQEVAYGSSSNRDTLVDDGKRHPTV
jgi:hypothetical protein